MSEIYEEALRIRTYDIDFAGIVGNIVFIRWLEDLRLGLMAQAYPLIQALAEDVAPILLATRIAYRHLAQGRGLFRLGEGERHRRGGCGHPPYQRRIGAGIAIGRRVESRMNSPSCSASAWIVAPTANSAASRQRTRPKAAIRIRPISGSAIVTGRR